MRTLDLNPDNLAAFLTIASVCGMAEQVDEGLFVVDKILKINPGV